MIISLNRWQFRACADEALLRIAVSGDRNGKHDNVRDRNLMTRVWDEITGSCTEMAVCMALGKAWTPSVNDSDKQVDIEPNIEVRGTENANGSLILRNQDSVDNWYFLVTGIAPTFEIVGFIKGSDGRDKRWIKDPNGHGPAYFIPQSELLPLSQWQDVGELGKLNA
jgi:hypothetical protein